MRLYRVREVSDNVKCHINKVDLSVGLETSRHCLERISEIKGERFELFHRVCWSPSTYKVLYVCQFGVLLIELLSYVEGFFVT